MFAWRVVCGSLLPILPRRPIAINSRPATDFFLAYNSFLPFLACVAWLLLLCYCCFLCTHFSCWRWCTDLCVSFIANPPPRRPIAINSRPATDCFEISDPRYSLRCKAAILPTFGNYLVRLYNIYVTYRIMYQRNPFKIMAQTLIPIVCCFPDIYICALPAAILSSSLVSLPFSTKNVFHFVHFLPQVCFSTKMPFILFPFFRKFVPPLGK